MHRPFPTNDQIQGWILGIEPLPYFEQFVEESGLLVLRAKDPPCDWRGLHMAFSDSRRAALAHDLVQLANGRTERLQYRSSYPGGRSWFELHTSGIHFLPSLNLSIDLDHECEPDDIWVRYQNQIVQLRLSAAAVFALASTVADLLRGGVRSHLVVRRDAKPAAAVQSLWLWHWKEREVAS
jgi:hypothetical protein